MQENIRIESQSQSVLATNKVLRNTYALLGLSLIPTAIGAYIGMSMNFIFAQQHPIMFAIMLLAGMFGLFFAIQANRNNSFGVVLLLALTLFLGVMLGPILQVAFSALT
ncbi:MAG: hypothetical protein RLZZ497_508 [Pseudomonadota bacterium]